MEPTLDSIEEHIFHFVKNKRVEDVYFDLSLAPRKGD